MSTDGYCKPLMGCYFSASAGYKGYNFCSPTRVNRCDFLRGKMKSRPVKIHIRFVFYLCKISRHNAAIQIQKNRRVRRPHSRIFAHLDTAMQQ